MVTNKMKAIHPGEILADELEALDGMSANKLSSLLSVPTNRITGILNGTRSITADTALRLARFFGTTPEFWLNLQDAYDLKVVRKISGKKIEREVAPYDNAA